MVGSCESNNEPSGFVNAGSQLLKDYFAVWNFYCLQKYSGLEHIGIIIILICNKNFGSEIRQHADKPEVIFYNYDTCLAVHIIYMLHVMCQKLYLTEFFSGDHVTT